MLISNQPHLLATQEFINGCGIGTSAPGERDLAAKFTGANSEGLVSLSNRTDTDLSSLTSWTISFWFKGTSSGLSRILHVGSLDASSLQCQVFINVNYLNLYAVDSGGTPVGFMNQGSAVFDTTTWHFITIGWDGSNFYAQIDNDAIRSVACTSINAPPVGGSFMVLGSPSLLPFTGSICGVSLWSRWLSDTERTALYNSGNGLTYNNLSDSLKVNLTSYWALNEASGTRNDSHSANHLTATGSPASESGVIAISYYNPRTALFDFADGLKSLGVYDNCSYWTMRSSQNIIAGQTTYSMGGLGRNTAILTGGPTKEDSGIIINAGSKYISINMPCPTSEVSLWMVKSMTAAGNFACFDNDTVSSARVYIPFGGNLYFDYPLSNPRLNGAYSMALNQFESYGLYGNPSGKLVKVNKANVLSDSIATAGVNNMKYLVVPSGTTGSHTVSFALIANKDLRAQSDAMYDLYKNKLGIGLNLQ